MLKALVIVALAVGCGPGLPEPESPGARVLVQRCTGCHAASAPGTMTLEMWKVQVARMQTEFARRGLPWLTPAEEQALMEYLGKYAGTS